MALRKRLEAHSVVQADGAPSSLHYGTAGPGELAVATEKRAQGIATGPDLVIKEATGRPIIRAGPGGRSSNTGHVVTVFGCTGNLGRYVTSKVARKGAQVVVPYRSADAARFLRPMGDLGQMVPLEFNARHDEQIAEAVRHSDAVYNCLGREYQTRNWSYRQVNVDIPRRIAEICNASGVSRLIHVSCVNADHDSPSEYYRTKAEGEDAVRAAFPGVTIVRPGPLYGWEGNFLHAPLTLWALPDRTAHLSPVHTLDVAEAMHSMLDAESTIGRLFDLRGPDRFTVEEVYALLAKARFEAPKSWSLPRLLIKLYESRYLFGGDILTRRMIDEKPKEADALGFDYFDIDPDRLQDQAPYYVKEYRKSEVYDRPLVEGGRKFKHRPFRISQ